MATLYDARPLPGGLNTYGIAEYKLPLRESLIEIDMLSQLGVNLQFNTPVDAVRLAELEEKHDAIFLGVGLGAIQRLAIPGELLDGITNALDFIAGYKAGEITNSPAKVIVIGAGNTAIDAAIAAIRLGASDVTIVYRQGAAQMSAFSSEYERAKREGVKFFWHVQPTEFLGHHSVEAVTLQRTTNSQDASKLTDPGSEFSLAADLVILAIGQTTHQWFPAHKIALDRGRISIDRATGQSSHPKYFAGGDCTNGGREVVDAVADGKRAGTGIAMWLEGQDART